MFSSKEIVETVRKRYPVGCRVRLVKMDDVQAPPIGTLGTVYDLEKAKKEALRYVADGVDKTYAIITNQGQRDTLDFDADDSSISYDVADIVYSAIKRNGRIIESFTETSNN